MFCMGCGAEVPARTVVCPVCGRDTGRGGDGRGARAQAEALGRVDGVSAASVSSAAGERGAHALALAAAPTTPAGPSIASGDLDQPGFPRDALGRSLIFTLLAMAADLLAPWVNLNGNRIAPSSLGLLPVVGVVWLSLAVLPLLRPSLRATPLYAAAPLVVGATSLGLAAAVWMRVTLFGSQTVVDSADGASLQSLGTSSSADVGLYLFLAGAVVLIIAGYQIFLAAAHAQAIAELRAEGSPPASERAAQGATVPVPRAASDGQWPSPIPTVLALDGAAVAASSSSRPLPPPPLPPSPTLPEASPSAGAAQPGVALPGSAAWNQAPHTPDFQRPSPVQGWRRRG